MQAGTKCHDVFPGQFTPFVVRFETDATEANSKEGPDAAKKNELNGAPGGTVGFMLSYAQIAC